MTTPAVDPVRASTPRSRRWTVVPAAALVLALGGFFSWRWLAERNAIDNALLLAENDFKAAEQELLGLHLRHPGEVRIVRALALEYLAAHDPVGAEKYLNLWCTLQPAQAEPFRQRLRLWTAQQKVGPAMADAERVLELAPNDFDVRRALVQILILDGRYQRAEQEGLRCFKARPDDVDLWCLLATTYAELGQAEKSAALLDQLLRKEPRHLGGLKLRARLYLEAGNPEQAIRIFEQIVDDPHSSPGQTEGLYELGGALARAGRGEEAKKLLAEAECRWALRLWKDCADRDVNAGFQERVVESMLAAGKTEEAVRFLTDILKRNPKAPPATHQLLATCHEKQGHPEQAAAERRRAGSKP